VGSEALCPSDSTTSIETVPDSIPFGFLDSPAPGQIISGVYPVYGWAFDDENPIGRVKIYIDDELIGTAFYDESRTDVANAYPGRDGSPNFGFSYELDTTLFSNGTHTISALAFRSSDTNAYMVPETVEFSIEN